MSRWFFLMSRWFFFKLPRLLHAKVLDISALHHLCLAQSSGPNFHLERTCCSSMVLGKFNPKKGDCTEAHFIWFCTYLPHHQGLRWGCVWLNGWRNHNSILQTLFCVGQLQPALSAYCKSLIIHLLIPQSTHNSPQQAFIVTLMCLSVDIWYFLLGAAVTTTFLPYFCVSPAAQSLSGHT